MALTELLNIDSGKKLINNLCAKYLRILILAVGAIIFIFINTVHGVQNVTAGTDTISHVFDVLIVRNSSESKQRTYRGLLAIDGKCSRISFYWLDPPYENDIMDDLDFSDILFTPEGVFYWYYKGGDKIYKLSPEKAGFGQLPVENNLNSVLGLTFNLVENNRTDFNNSKNILETTRFFQNSRDYDHFDYSVEQNAKYVQGEVKFSNFEKYDYGIFNELPFGRKYSMKKENGNITWQIIKDAVSTDVLSMTIVPKDFNDTSSKAEMFNPDSLGKWSDVPESYRKYKPFKDRYLDIRRYPDFSKAQNLYTDIDLLIDTMPPNDLNLALQKLRFQTSLETGSYELIYKSTIEYYEYFRQTSQEPVDGIFVELGNITQGLIKKLTYEQTRELVFPLLKSLMDTKLFSNQVFLQNMIFSQIYVRGNIWEWYGFLVIEILEKNFDYKPEFIAQIKKNMDPLVRMSEMMNSIKKVQESSNIKEDPNAN
jgi:hypothetical protein